MKTENRKCPICEKSNEIPVDAMNFTCPHCSTNLIKINRPLLTEVFTTKDEIDKEIYRKIIINFCSQLNSEGIIFENNKEKQEAFTGCLLEIMQSLSKANSCRRAYIQIEEKEIKSLYERNKGDNYVGAVVPVDLNTQLDGVLIHLKSALDSLAKATKPLFGFSLPTWKKVRDKDGKEKSGLAVFTSLKNISETPDDNLKNITKFVADNLEWISFLVNLRDKPVHHGKTQASNLIYSEHTQKVTPQLIIYPTGKELVVSFMEKSIKEITDFIHIFLRLSFNVKAKNGETVVFDDKGDAFWYVPGLEEFIRSEKEKSKESRGKSQNNS